MNNLDLMECCGVESKCSLINGDGRVYVMIIMLPKLKRLSNKISKN
jgi:hypothetical protein